MAIRGILFDKDGVIVDFDKTWAPALKVIARDLARGDLGLEAHYLEVAGYDSDADVFVSGSIWAAGNTIDLVAAWLPDGTQADRQAMAERVDGYCATCTPEPIFPVAQLSEIFGTLAAAGYRLGVATNDSEASARATVGKFGLADHFDLVMGYNSVANPKPAADPVHMFADHCGIPVHELAMVGDNCHDAEMARVAGTGLAIGVLSGNGTREDLAGLTDYILNDISELSALLISRVRTH